MVKWSPQCKIWRQIVIFNLHKCVLALKAGGSTVPGPGSGRSGRSLVGTYKWDGIWHTLFVVSIFYLIWRWARRSIWRSFPRIRDCIVWPSRASPNWDNSFYCSNYSLISHCAVVLLYNLVMQLKLHFDIQLKKTRNLRLDYCHREIKLNFFFFNYINSMRTWIFAIRTKTNVEILQLANITEKS